MEGLKNMNKEYEAIQIGVYIDAVYTILKEHKDMSLIQLSFYTYILNKTRFFLEEIYTARVKNNIVIRAISVISGDFEGFSNAMPYILKALHIMNESKIVSIEGQIVHLIDKQFKNVNCFKISNFENKAINASKGWSDKRFIKEVLHSV